jgi:hypothetical protein
MSPDIGYVMLGAFFLGLATGLCFGFLFRGWLHEWRTGR